MEIIIQCPAQELEALNNLTIMQYVVWKTDFKKSFFLPMSVQYKIQTVLLLKVLSEYYGFSMLLFGKHSNFL